MLVYSFVVSFLLQQLLAGQSFCGFEACLQLEKDETLNLRSIRKKKLVSKGDVRALKLTGGHRLRSNWLRSSVPAE